MTDTNAQEPTMEEILASIRRIISEDESPAAAAPPEPANGTAELEAAEPEPERPAPAPPAAGTAPHAVDEDDDILELTQPAPPLAQAAPSQPQPAAARASDEQLGDLEVFARPEPQPEPFAATAMTAASEPEDTLISPPAADLAASAFGQLSRTVSMPAEGRTLEDVVRELLRPMLKGWLDQHLPPIVEAAVRAEVERISRLRRL